MFLTDLLKKLKSSNAQGTIFISTRRVAAAQRARGRAGGGPVNNILGQSDQRTHEVIICRGRALLCSALKKDSEVQCKQLHRLLSGKLSKVSQH